MTFVPFVQPPSPSPRAYELSRRLIEAIGNFRRDNPNTTNLDIRQAINLAMNEVRTRNQAVLVSLLVVMLGLGALVFFFASSQSRFGNQMMILAFVIVAGIFVIVLSVLRRNR
jgi:hypothetical protein